MTTTPETTNTPTASLKGGDRIRIGDTVREVFDTYAAGYGHTLVRYYGDRNVESVRVASDHTFGRVN